LSISSFSHVLARKKARDKSLQEPVFGLDERREGILVGMRGKEEGVVVKMEIRRRSGRGVVEDFVMLPPVPSSTSSSKEKLSDKLSTIMLLDEHPLYTSIPIIAGGAEEQGDEDVQTTFSLGLTEKQKRDREGVVLPYFDAQKEGGGTEGGRILYEMGAEDREDFDDEEDEI
jgi:elongator complex protein 5